MTLTMWIATAAWMLLVLGYLNRANRNRHVPLVLSGIGIDIALVLYLQVARDAVGTAMQFKLGFFEQSHILVSTVALLLYFPVLVLGSKLYFGLENDSTRKQHRTLAIAALLFRSAGFVLMFSMWR